MKSPTKSPTFIIGLVLAVLGILFIFIGQTRSIGALLLFVGSICMLIPIARSVLGTTPTTAPKKATATTPDEALHSTFSHLRTTTPPQTTSGQAATQPRPVTPPRPKPTLSSTVPKLPNEIHRIELDYDYDELCIVTQEKLILWQWSGPAWRMSLSDVSHVDVQNVFGSFYVVRVWRGPGIPAQRFGGLNVKRKQDAYELAQIIRTAAVLYG